MSIVVVISTILISLGLIVLTAIVIYLWFFALMYFATSRRETPTNYAPQSRFVFIVPAHNEEKGITATIASLLSVNYPRNLFDVVVIADNCTDGTVEKARSEGAICFERNDATLKGKGYALCHAFTRLISRGFSAFIVIDADSIVSKNFLSVLDARLLRGEKVIQGYYGISNPDASVLTYLFQVGNIIENKLYWEPKQAFGLPIILRGNGMCFAKEIVEKYPWNAFSITEDTEYGMMLIDNNIRIHFASEIGVYACQPETLQQAFAQRVRWAAGNSTLTKGRALKMILSGAFSHNLARADLGISLIAGSRPLALMANIFLLFAAYMANSQIMICWGSFIFIAQLLYVGLGAVMNGITLQKVMRLFISPFYLAWLCIVSLLGAVGFRKNQWVRTTRS